jgi:hypothetical protein
MARGQVLVKAARRGSPCACPGLPSNTADSVRRARCLSRWCALATDSPRRHSFGVRFFGRDLKEDQGIPRVPDYMGDPAGPQSRYTLLVAVAFAPGEELAIRLNADEPIEDAPQLAATKLFGEEVLEEDDVLGRAEARASSSRWRQTSTASLRCTWRSPAKQKRGGRRSRSLRPLGHQRPEDLTKTI